MLAQYAYPPVNQAVVETGCYVTAVGSAAYGRGQTYPPAGHPVEFQNDWANGRVLPDAVILNTLVGLAEWETRHDRGQLQPGSVLFLPPGEWHRYRPVPAKGWGETWLCIRGAGLHRLIERGLIPDQVQVTKCDKLPDWKSRLDRLRAEILRQPNRNLLSWGSRALSILLELWEHDLAGEFPGPVVDEGNLFQVARHFIEQNSHRPILVQDVARACGCSRRTLERLFQEADWNSIADTITAQRLARAKNLLQETRLGVKQVAGDTGFSSPQHFIACFRRWEKCTPSQFRRGEERSA